MIYRMTDGFVGSLLAFAAMAKAYPSLPGPGARPFPPSSAFLAASELSLGLVLLSGFRREATRLITVGCFVVFGAVSMARSWSGMASCGCFGDIATSPGLTLSLDLAILAALAGLGPEVAGRPISRTRRYCVVSSLSAASSLLLLILLSAWTSDRGLGRMMPDGSILGDGEVVVLRPDEWVGQPCPLLGHIESDTDLTRGRWTLVLLRKDCGGCRDSLPDYLMDAEAHRRDPDAPRVALIEVPSSGTGLFEIRRSDRSYAFGTLDPKHAWSVPTPSRIELLDRVVLSGKPSDRIALPAATSESRPGPAPEEVAGMPVYRPAISGSESAARKVP